VRDEKPRFDEVGRIPFRATGETEQVTYVEILSTLTIAIL
jgi:hypothetical protein